MLNNLRYALFCSVMFSPLMLMIGCISNKSTEPQIPISYYQAPTPSTNTASIIGARVERKSILADTVAYVFAVDGQKVVDAEQNLNQPLRLEAGQRDLQLWCQQGGYKYSNVLTVNIEANKHYQVGYQMRPFERDTCYLWIYDLDAKQGIGELTESISLWENTDPQTMRPMTGYVEPTPKASSTTVPIFISNK